MRKYGNDRRADTGRLSWTLAAALLAVWSFAAAAANAQRLWSVGEVSRVPDGPAVVMEGARVVPGGVAPGMPGVAQPAVSAEIAVTFDYLRLGMGYLELPLPDGSMIEAENAVFEDRGGGDLMWTGEVPGAGYESVVLTVQGGHLVGWFGEPGGPKYVVYAGPDGRGSLAEEVGPTGDWCGVEEGPSHDLVQNVARAGLPTAVASGASDDSLDILVLYPEETENYWRLVGGPAVGVRQLGDWLNMAFRNGEIPATANLIPVRWDPELTHHPRTQEFHFARVKSADLWHSEFHFSPNVEALRKRHKPDLIHFIPDVGVSGVVGTASLRTGLDPLVLHGWSTPFSSATFAHEVGHNLGGSHHPADYGERFPEVQSRRFRPYGFGYRNDVTATIMAQGRTSLPFYSSVRHKPNGQTIGVAGTSEVERVFYETVPVQARSGAAEDREDRAPAPPLRSLHARWADRFTARVTWSDRLSAGEFLDLVYFDFLAMDGSSDRYNVGGYVDYGDGLVDATAANVTPIVENGFLTGAEIRGLRPGGLYRIATRGNPGGRVRSAPTLLRPPTVAGAPTAPSNVGARVTGSDSIRLHWRDNSGVEDGYEVWYRKWSGDEPDEVWQRYGEPLPVSTRYVDVDGLAAEESVSVASNWAPGIGRYSFVVVAYNDRGWSASETFHLEFMPGPHPKPTTAGRATDCLARGTGIDLDGYRITACLETPDGARRRMWDYQLEADQSGLLYFFDRDNAEILVKVLDGCAVNGHRWVFIAPVTTLPFKLIIQEPGPDLPNRRKRWYYDSKRRPQGQIPWVDAGNPKDRTARTVSDTTAFPCTAAEIAAAKAASADRGRGAGFASVGAAPAAAVSGAARSLRAGARTDCDPGAPTLTLRGGYTVNMCYETYDDLVGDARDWGLDSSQSGLLYFFERNNAEVLIKVLDGCGVNGHRWVFVAPVTDLAFNLVVESPSGERWTHSNRLGRTADAASDVSAFPCTSSA